MRNGTKILGTLTALAVAVVGLAVSPPDIASAQPHSPIVKTLDLPTWDDVEQAKKNEKAAAAKVSEIEDLIVQVQAQVETTRAASVLATEGAIEAEEAYLAAHLKTVELETQAAESEERAAAAASQAAALVSQMYRSGGVDRNVELFLESDADTADVLLDRLAMMSKATERNTSISDEAEQAMNTARSLGEQAEDAQAERERLHQVAEEEAKAAAEAAEAARVELLNQEDQQKELESQLAALKDETVETTKGYQERLRIEEEQRRQRELEAARRAAELARQQQQQQQQNPGGGGGGGGASTPPPVTSGGWVRPLPAGSYFVSTEWWGYYGHTAMDLATWGGRSEPIYAAASGTVTAAGWIGIGGNMVYIDHGGGISTRYAHMIATPIVGYGQWVNAGQIIGYVGSTGMSTGPHLHFEVLTNGIQINPRPFMNARGIWL